MQKTLYITGGTGFIGSALVNHFAEQGCLVYVQTRSTKGYKDEKLIKYLQGPEQVDRKIDVLINLAGKSLATRWNEKTKAEIYRSRVDFTNNLAESFSLIPEFAPQRVISTSAIGYYQTGDRPNTEDGQAGQGFSAKLCRDWESAARSFEKLGSKVSILRLGVVLDKKGGSLKAMLPSFKLGLGARLGTGEQWFSWIGLKDLVNIYQYCLESPDLPQSINAVSPSPVTNKEFTTQLAHSLGRPAIFVAPKFLLKAIFAEGAEDFLLANIRVLPGYLAEVDFAFEEANLEELFERLFG